MKTIESKVEKIIKEWMEEGNTFDMDKPLVDQGLDSLDFVEIVMSLEDDFCIQIPDDDANKIKTPRAFVDYIRQYPKGTK